MNEDDRRRVEDLITKIIEADTDDFRALADLAGLDFRRDLQGADLSGADLSRLDLSGADLRFCTLNGASLAGSSLIRADLHRADLSGADLRGTCLDGARLREANLTGVIFDEGTSLRGADVEGALGATQELLGGRPGARLAVLPGPSEKPLALLDNLIGALASIRAIAENAAGYQYKPEWRYSPMSSPSDPMKKIRSIAADALSGASRWEAGLPEGALDFNHVILSCIARFSQVLANRKVRTTIDLGATARTLEGDASAIEAALVVILAWALTMESAPSELRISSSLSKDYLDLSISAEALSARSHALLPTPGVFEVREMAETVSIPSEAVAIITEQQGRVLNEGGRVVIRLPLRPGTR